VLHEEVMECSYINNLHPGDTVGAISFVHSVKENVEGDLEEVHLRTIGVKNLDVESLKGVPIPKSLFKGPVRRPRDYKKLCDRECTVLSDRIVACIDRKLLRQPPKSQLFLL
jgi:hypothetical protein